MTYEIRKNHQFNSAEIYFDGKPSEEVRNALKALKFRWHSVKKALHTVLSMMYSSQARVDAVSCTTRKGAKVNRQSENNHQHRGKTAI